VTLKRLVFSLALAASGLSAAEEATQDEAQLSADNRNNASLAVAENVQDASLLRFLLEGRQLFFFGRLEGEFALYDIPALDGENGADLRRFRVGLAGVQPWWENVSYKLELDLNSDGVDLSSMYVSFDFAARGALTVGNQDVTQNLSANTGSLSQLFMEAPLPATAFSLTQRLAISYDWESEQSALHTMVFGKDPNIDIGDRGWAARAVFSPYRSETGIWHVGGSVVWENVDGETRLASRPESHVTDIRFLDTGNLSDVEQRTAYSIELAGANGPFTGRLEAFRTEWDRTGGRRNRFVGAYWEAGYFLTGQSFRYRLGKFVRPKLDDGQVAWELGLRLSWTDLNDGAVKGGEQRNAGVALNCYPRPNLRGQFNLIQVNSDRPGGDGPLLQARLQFNW
jgi:phosphate-selective porin OprO/OprP